MEVLNLNSKLAVDIHKISFLLSQLKESETYVANIVSRYFQDVTVKTHLLDALKSYSKLHFNADLRTHNLTNEMCLYQNDVLKNQENSLQHRINSVIKNNRLLLIKIDELTNQNEKLCISVQQLPENTRHISDSALLDRMNNSNDKLRSKVRLLYDELERQEVECCKLQKNHALLGKQLQNTNLQLQNYRDIVRRVETDNKLEHEHLLNELQNSQRVIKESADAGDVVLEDLDSLKRQFKTMTCTINWTKFKCRGNSLPDLIYMCRSCINELSKGLLQYQNENALKEKDMESLKQEIARHESEMEQIKDEHNALHEHIKDLSNKDVDIQNYKSKYEITERNFKEYKDETERLSEHYHNENRTLLATIEEMDGLKRQALEKDEEMILMKEQIAGYKSENDTLRMQLQGLRQILSASGTGEVARELAETQEKLVVFQSYYYQILSEKNVLMEKLQNINFERVSLNQFQTTSSQFMQTQQQELSAMKRDYLLLKQNFEVEQKQSAELKLECCKLKDEKILMKKIYEQLKMDVDRMQTLEGKMLGMNMKASRLAIIADYNKQLGEKLQLEVVERDVKITELETNMIQLNNAQIENSKEKVALCVELKEVCSLNDKLNNSLEFEQQKIGELNETKKRIESTATFQLKAAVEMQKAERAALVNLLSEYKHVVEQRDGLLKSQTEYVQKISELHANVLILKNNLEATYLKLEQELETNKDLDKRLSRANEELNKIRDIPEHDEKQNELTMLKEQNQHLDASVSYLQNTIQQLNKDLDKARESEMELKRELDSELKKLEYLKKLSEEQKDVCSKQEKENRDMVLGLTNISKQYEELLHNYKHEMMVSKEKNEELEGIRRINNQQTCTIEQLQKSITEKNEEMKSLRAKHGELSSQIEDMEQSVEDFDIQAKLLSESNTKQAHLKIYLSDLHKDYERCLENTKKLEDENTNLLEQIKQYSDHAEYHCTHYKNCISEMMTQHEQDRNELVTDLETLSINFEQVKLKYRQHKQKYDDIVNQRKSLVTELLKATQMIIKEKESNVECRDKLEKSLQSNSQLVAENVQAKNEIIILTDQVDQLQTKSKEHIMEKKKLHKIIVHLENAQNQLEAEVANSKTDTKELEEKYNKLQSASNEMENELNETQRKLTIAQQLAKTMKEDLDDNHKLTMNLRSEISQLSQNLTTTEFQNAEITFRLHELQASLNTEKNINVELTAINKKIIGDILKIESGLSTSLLTPLCDFASNT